MIRSILDSDLYKFSMQCAVMKLFPNAKVQYEFIDRNNITYPNGFDEELRKRVHSMAELKLKMPEYMFLSKTCPYLDKSYLDFLMGYKYDPSEVGIIQKDGKLQIKISGYWYRTILWEVPLMAMISELYFEMTNQKSIDINEQTKINTEKAQYMRMHALKFADFGTRRRYSYDVQKKVIYDLMNYGGESFVGTSNVHFAMMYNTKPIGTHAHEWFMFHSAKYGYKFSNSIALDNWSNVYRGNLGIALSDTLTTDIFLKSFDMMHAKLFDGVRHDSGDPFIFMDKVIDHYIKLGIDPISKTIIYSDGLNVKEAERIAKYCKNRIKLSFGIGTNFTNDVGVTPLNIVIKMTAADPNGDGEWTPTVKLSDNPGKHTGLPEEIELCKKILKI